jgi:CRISPR-associated protein Csx3
VTPDVAGPPWVLTSGGRLTAVLVDGGAPATLGTDALELVQHAASPYEAGYLQLWLRDADRAWPLLGPGSGGVVRVDGTTAVVSGCTEPGDLVWSVTLTLDAERTAWAWHVEVVNAGPGPREVDVVHAHDVALAHPGALRANELYVSQYLDVHPLHGGSGGSDGSGGSGVEGDTLGTAVAVRQNLPQSGRNPWCVLAATGRVVAWATDVLDVHGWSARSGGAPGPVGDLPSRRRQHEHTLVTLQTERVTLDAGGTHRVTFGGLLVDDHPDATSDADLSLVEEARTLARAAAPWADARTATPPPDGRRAPSGLYDAGHELRTRPLTEDELAERWPGPHRAAEVVDGRTHSFFTADDEHVVTQAKELVTLRPHGTILRTGATAAPDPTGLTVTAWMTGSPLSYLTRGHASAGRVLTTVRGYLGLHRAYGLRVFVEVDGTWRLLDLPSAFAMGLDAAHWVHALADGTGVVEVRTTAPADAHHVRLDVRTTTGPERRVLLALHLATDEDPLPAVRAAQVEVTPTGVTLGVARGGGLRLDVATSRPCAVGDGGLLLDDGVARDASTVTLLADGPLTLDLRVAGPPPGSPAGADLATAGSSAASAIATPGRSAASATPTAGTRTPAVAGRSAPDAPWWTAMTALRVLDEPGRPDVEALAVSLPWLVHDALVHHLSPRGLEQYTGGAWGTRDVTQGPLELLLALDRLADARALVLRVFAAQNLDGSWPQAFGFVPGDEDFRHEPPHGDVVHWPVLALGRYLQASGDASVLDEAVDWYAPPTQERPPSSSLLSHVERALDRARSAVLPGTRLVAYGHGDWNDSLQPADPAMAGTLASAWTVTLHHQALSTLGDGLRTAGVDPALVDALRHEADTVSADLHRYLLVDGELAGYVQLDPPHGSTDPGDATPAAEPRVRRLLVHPRDTETGLRHGSLPMIHALGADLFDREQAAHHVALVREHLMGVDGVRLFDRPPAYHGGPMRHFQRAETATFVGREIGLMYVHAHLRWCEAMARWGDAEALWHGLLQVLPAAAAATVPGARPRQANAYPSSSDAACLDRADFADRYAQVLDGTTGLEAGWRVYSSGPGVLVRIVAQSLLGVRRRADVVEVDPVLPARLDGLRASVPLDGGLLRVHVRVGPRGHGPSVLRLAGRELRVARTANPYREGGLAVALDDLRAALVPRGPELEVEVP